MYLYTTYILFSEYDRRFTDKVQKKKSQNFFAKFFSNFFFPHQKRMEESNSTVTDHSLPSFSARNIRVHKRFHIFQLCTSTLHTFYLLNMIDASPTKFKKKNHKIFLQSFFQIFFSPIRSVWRSQIVL
jgi:hypothetical protein